MRRFMFFLLSATMLGAVAGLSSCTREYVCRCTIEYSGQPGLPGTVVNEYTIRDTKNKAASLCEGNSTTTDANGIHTEENCVIY